MSKKGQKVEQGARRGVPWAAIGWGAAALLIVLQSLVFHFTWVRQSQIAPPEGLHGGTQWGGSAVARTQPPRMFFDNDSYYWIAYSRDMIKEGRLRVRKTDLDNAPYGREVHWSSFLCWSIVLLAGAKSLVTGSSWLDSVEDAALWVNPLLYTLLLAAAAVVVARRLGGFPAAVCVVAAALLPPLLWDFAYGRPDHHGLQSTTAFGQLLCVIFGGGGWVLRTGKPPQPGAGGFFTDLRTARRWFAIAGVFGGAALGVGATQQAMIIGATGVGALIAMFLCRARAAESEDPQVVCDPGLWRVWGFWGAGSSLVFYLVEYFPGHIMQMRLEVNGPLFTLAFACGGLLLARIGNWMQGDGRFPVVATSLLLAGCMVYPLAVLLGPTDWHSMRSPEMRRLHDFISEFRPLWTVSEGNWWQVAARFGLFLALPIAAVWLLRPWKKNFTPGTALLLLLLPPVLLLAVWTFVQARWAGLLASSLIVLLATMFALRKAEPWRFVSIKLWKIGLALLLGLQVFFFSWPLPGAVVHARHNVISPQLAGAIAVRDVALNLARYAPVLGQVRVMSGPSETPSLHHFGNLRGTGALYWENLDGVLASAAFFADYGEEEARRIAAERGIHFVIAPQSPDLADFMHWCQHGTKNPADLEKTLAWRLGAVRGTIPEWLEPVPHYASQTARHYGLRIYRVRLPDSDGNAGER